jgi:protein-disulfide isomerase
MRLRARHIPLALAAGVALWLGMGLPAFAAAGPTISVGAAPSLKTGSPEVVLIEMSDFQCPYCGRSAREVLPRLEENLVRSGKVEVVFLNLPLPIHSDAFLAAEAAMCAGYQKKFWEMHHLLFANQQALAAAQLPGYAEKLGLDVAAFQKCLSDGQPAGEIRREMRLADELGIAATPIYLLGRRVPGSDKIQIVETIRGVRPYEELEKKLNQVLDADRNVR